MICRKNEKKTKSGKKSISVIGLGKAGLPLAAVIADNGFFVVGVDVDEKRCRQINNGINTIPKNQN